MGRSLLFLMFCLVWQPSLKSKMFVSETYVAKIQQCGGDGLGQGWSRKRMKIDSYDCQMLECIEVYAVLECQKSQCSHLPP